MARRVFVSIHRFFAITFLSLVLIGCGVGEGPEQVLDSLPPVAKQTGLLLDSAVSGVTYNTATQSGVTNALGEFEYVNGEMVTFSIGGIVLGTAQGSGILTPVELTASVNPTNQAALNLLVFLQSIDEDRDHTNGITISSAARNNAAGMNLEFKTANFATQIASIVAQITGGANPVVSEATALSNFYATYVQIGGTNSVSFLFPGFPPVGGTPTAGVPDYIFATDSSVTPNWEADVDFIYGDWGTQGGANGIFDGSFAGDTDYNPVWQAKGADGQWGSVLAMSNFTAGFASAYDILLFKVRLDGGAGTTVNIKFPGATIEEVAYDTAAVGTALGNGWYQMEIALSDFGSVSAATEFAIFTAQANTMYLTDIGFDVEAGDPEPPTPDAVDYIFATDSSVTPNWVADTDFTYGDWGTQGGANGIFDGSFAGDADYNPVWQAKGADGQWGSVLAMSGFTAGFASAYDILLFKVKLDGGAGTTVNIKFPAATTEEVAYDTAAVGTALGNGWYQMEIALSDFGSVSAATEFAIFTAQANTMYLTDIGFSVTSGGGTGGGSGEQLGFNGDFEAGNGDLSDWTLTPNAGSITAVNDQDSGSTWAVSVSAVPGNASALSLDGLGVGTVQPGDIIDVSFDMCAVAADGGEIAVALLSEKGPGNGADRVELVRTATPADVWTRYNYSTTAGVDVTGGVSLQFDVVCGGAPSCVANAYFDNVSITLGGGPVAGSATGASCAAPPPPGVTLPIDFEDGPYVFTDFDGGQASIEPNSQPAGINVSANVGKMLKFAGAPWGGSTFDLGGTLTVPADSSFIMKVWSSRPVPVLFKLEGGPAAEVTAIHSGSSDWEELVFDFTGITTGDHTAITFIFDNGVAGEAATVPGNWTFYFDDIDFAPAPPAANVTLFADAFAPGWVGFLDANGTVTPVTDSDPTYGQVLEITTGGNTVVGLGSRAAIGGDGVNIDTSRFAVLEFDLKLVTAPTSGTTNWRLKVENPGQEIGIAAPVLDTWVRYSIPMADLGTPATLDLIMLFPDYSFNAGAVYRLDNVKLLEQPSPPPAVDITLFEDTFATGWVGFLDATGTVTEVTDSDPTYGQVLEITTGGNTVVGLGSRAAIGGDGVNIDTSDYAVLEFDLKLVTAPTSGTTNWRLKAENPGQEIGIDAPVLDTWVHYSIPMSTLGTPGALDLIMLFPEYGANAGAVYRLDNVKLLVVNPGGGGTVSGEIVPDGSFETVVLGNAPWYGFPQNGTAEISSVQSRTGSFSAHLLADVDGNGGNASFPQLKVERVGDGSLPTGPITVTVSFYLFGSSTSAGTMVAEFFSEGAGGAVANQIILNAPGGTVPTNSWVEHSFNVTTAADISGGISLLFKADCGGNPGCVMDVYIDDVSIIVP